jgi:hypothetical protein
MTNGEAVTAFTPGTRVKIVADCGPLGVLDTPGSYKFDPDVIASPGDECEVVSYDGQMPEGWLLVLHLASNKFAPVHPGMIETA